MAYTHPLDAPILYVNRDQSALVPEDSPEAAFVLVGPGGTLSDALAGRYGLTGDVSRETIDEPKQAAGPAENKVIKPKANKRTK